MIQILKSKIHRATVTEANLEYSGSITLSKTYLDSVMIREYEKVLIVDVNNGNRFETYVIQTFEDNVVCINGAAARLVSVGDKIIIMAFKFANDNELEGYKPRVLLLDDNNEEITNGSV